MHAVVRCDGQRICLASSRSAEPCVLLIEDEENVAYVVALALRHSGSGTASVGTGAEALSISSSNPMPDIVVLDVMLPDAEGFEACRRMHADQNDVPHRGRRATGGFA